MRPLALFLTLAGVALEAPEFAEPYVHRALELKIGKPAGWDAVFENGVLVLHKDGVGFRVSRQMFLHDPKAFPAAWESELAAAGFPAKVTAAKVGKHEAFRAAYELPEPKRVLEVWRVRVADGEWLYNVAFSVPAGYDARPLVEGALRPFECTEPAPKLEWNATSEQLGNHFQFRLPRGYGKDPTGRPGSWVAYHRDSEPPRERGRFGIEQYDSRARYALPGGKEVSGGDLDGIALVEWSRLASALAKAEKPRSVAGRAGPFKGTIASGAAAAQDGTAKMIYVFATKTRQIPVAWSLVVDARDVRLFPNLFKEILESFKEP